MKISRSIFALPLVSGVLIISSALMTGCIGRSDQDPAGDTAEETQIDESSALAVPAQSEVRFEQTNHGQAASLVPNAAWKEVAPGVYENQSEEGPSRVIVGAEGHQWAIEQAEADLEDLRARKDSVLDDDRSVVKAIREKEVSLEDLKVAAKGIAQVQAGPASLVSCSIGFYTGPSSPISGYYGSAALAQVSCSSGCQTFSIATKACTNYGCTPVTSSSKFVCATPWTFGVAKSGSFGAACSSAASVSPPGVTSSWSGTCG